MASEWCPDVRGESYVRAPPRDLVISKNGGANRPTTARPTVTPVNRIQVVIARTDVRAADAVVMMSANTVPID
jgi:hypothetical protein